MSPDQPAGEGGAIALLLLISSFVLLAAGLTLIATVTDLSIAAARARTAADAAALAVLSTTDDDPCRAASNAADANGASLLSCDTNRHHLVDGAPHPAAEVEVEVTPSTPLTRSLTGPIPARAAAALHPTGLALIRRLPAGDVGTAYATNALWPGRMRVSETAGSRVGRASVGCKHRMISRVCR